MAKCHEKNPFGPVAKVYTKFQDRDGRSNSNKISGNPTHTYTIHFDSENGGNGGNTFLRKCGNPGQHYTASQKKTMCTSFACV